MKNLPFKMKGVSGPFLLFALAALVAVNVVVAQLDWRYDLTQDKWYSISQGTKDILDGLTQDVEIYPLFFNEDKSTVMDMAREMLSQYAAYSSHVKVTAVDPLTNPQFAAQFQKAGEEIAPGSIIVKSGQREKVIAASSLVTAELNMQTFQQEIVSVDVEPQVSNAIVYVTLTQAPVVYAVTGHEEVPLPEQFKGRLEMAGFELLYVDLFKEAVPADCGMLLVTTPATDWTAEEAQKASAYFKAGGRGLFLLDHLERPMDNLAGVLAQYGVKQGGAFLAEGDPNQYVQGNPLNILPLIGQTAAAGDMVKGSYRVLMPYAQGVAQTDTMPTGVTLEPVLETTQKAYAKTSPNMQSISKETGDTDGPFVLAMAVRKEGTGNTTDNTKLMVVGNSYILEESVNSYVGDGNYRFLLSAVNWLQDKGEAVYIPPKTANSEVLMVNQASVLVLGSISILVLPGAILAAGLVVWMKRRNS